MASRLRNSPFVITGMIAEETKWTLGLVEKAIGDDNLTHFVRSFDPTGVLQNEAELTFKQYKQAIVSGEAAKSDMYWSYSTPGENFTKFMHSKTKLYEA